MNSSNDRLTALTNADIEQLQNDVDELARLQDFLNRLPMGLQVETLSEPELERFREIARSPIQELCGPSLLVWHNMARQRCWLR